MFKNRYRKKGLPTPNYEGREHVKSYEDMDPEESEHDIRYPEDEPHMKSRVSKEESHEMEDDYHFKNPHRKERLPAHLPDNHGKDEEVSTQKRVGNLITRSNRPMEDEHETGYEDDEKEENSRKMPKEHRKGMIIAVLQRKLKKRNR